MNELDPIRGLIDYIQDIKPYHTKVIEILTEYVYAESIGVSITENFQLDIGLFFGGTPGEISIGDQIITLGGWGGTTPFDGFTSWPVIPPSVTLAGGPFVDAPLGYDIGSDTVMIPGDRTNQYIVGLNITIDLYAFDTALNTRTAGVQTSYTIVDVEYVSFGQINGVSITPHTVITVAALNDPATTLPALGPNEVYAAGVNLDPFTIDSVVGYSNAAPVFYTDVPPGLDPTPTPTIGSLPQSPDENPGMLIFSNSFVVAGDFEIAFPQGYRFEVVGGTTEGAYTVKYAYYDAGMDKTYIRVIEHINVIGFVAGVIQEMFFGYGESVIDQTQIPIGLTATQMVESLVFSWSDSFLISGQDETNYNGAPSNGSFVGGNGVLSTAYFPADTITLEDGSIITVDTVDVNGDVTEFTVTSSSVVGAGIVVIGNTINQSSTSGMGSGFALTPGSANVVTSTDVIDGYQFVIKQATNPSTFQVNGDATTLAGGNLRVIGSSSNDGVYTVAGVSPFDGQFTDITVAEVSVVTEQGGWVEKYIP